MTVSAGFHADGTIRLRKRCTCRPYVWTPRFAAAILALVFVSALRGIDRGDVFEVIVISIVWLTLIAGGILTAIVFRRAMSR